MHTLALRRPASSAEGGPVQPGLHRESGIDHFLTQTKFTFLLNLFVSKGKTSNVEEISIRKKQELHTLGNQWLCTDNSLGKIDYHHQKSLSSHVSTRGVKYFTFFDLSVTYELLKSVIKLGVINSEMENGSTHLLMV